MTRVFEDVRYYPKIRRSTVVGDIVTDAIGAARSVIDIRGENTVSFGHYWGRRLNEIYSIEARVTDSASWWRRHLSRYFSSVGAEYRITIINKELGLGVVFWRYRGQYRFIGTDAAAEQNFNCVLSITAEDDFALVNTVYTAFRPLLVAGGMIRHVTSAEHTQAIAASIRRPVNSDLTLDVPPR